MLEKACDQLKLIKNRIHIKEGDLLESTPELKKADLVFACVPSLFDEHVYMRDREERNRIIEIRRKRKKILQRKLSQAKHSKIVTFGLELPEREMIDEKELRSGGFLDVSSALIRVYRKD